MSEIMQENKIENLGNKEEKNSKKWIEPIPSENTKDFKSMDEIRQFLRSLNLKGSRD
jgi:hypothetical protein